MRINLLRNLYIPGYYISAAVAAAAAVAAKAAVPAAAEAEHLQ